MSHFSLQKIYQFTTGVTTNDSSEIISKVELKRLTNRPCGSYPSSLWRSLLGTCRLQSYETKNIPLQVWRNTPNDTSVVSFRNWIRRQKCLDIEIKLLFWYCSVVILTRWSHHVEPNTAIWLVLLLAPIFWFSLQERKHTVTGTG